MTEAQIRETMAEVKKRTQKTAYQIHIEHGKEPGILDSKFGGAPYWDLSKEYPTDSDGDMLALLAQINFDQLDTDGTELPDKGMLQFFIKPDDVFGLDFDEPDLQDRFRVVYHETVDAAVTKEQILALCPPVSVDTEDMPVYGEYAIAFEKREISMSDSDYRYDALFEQCAKEKYGAQVEYAGTLYAEAGEDTYEAVTSDEFQTVGHWLLGYPFFTQSDVRGDSDALADYDTLLFQMDSDSGDQEEYVLWGDCGVANFFIHSEDLKKRDFHRVLYNWDCC